MYLDQQLYVIADRLTNGLQLLYREPLCLDWNEMPR